NCAVGIGVMKTVSIDAKECIVFIVDAVVQAQEGHPAGIVADKNSRRNRRSYRRAAVLTAIFPAKKELRGLCMRYWAGKCSAQLAQRIGDNLVAIACAGSGKPGEPG